MLRSLLPLLQKLKWLLKYPRVSELSDSSQAERLPENASIPIPGEFTSAPPQTWDEQDFMPTPPKPPSPMSKNPPVSSAGPVMFLLCIWVFASLTNWTSPNDQGWVSGKAVFEDGEYWRLVSALFIHSDVGHLLANMPLFLVFGFYLNGFFGFLVFPIAALIAGVLANLLTIMIYPPWSRLVGASGMLYAMVAMWLVLYVRFEQGIPWGKRLLRAVGVGLILLFPTTFHPTTSYAAHGFGFLVGILAAFVLGPIARKKIGMATTKEESVRENLLLH